MKVLKFMFKKRFSWVEFLGICTASSLYPMIGLWGLFLLLLLVMVVQRVGEAVVEDVK